MGCRVIAYFPNAEGKERPYYQGMLGCGSATTLKLGPGDNRAPQGLKLRRAVRIQHAPWGIRFQNRTPSGL